jgi:hypothetical protein
MTLVRRLWSAWKRFGQFTGDMIGRVVLTVFYFTLFAPFGLGVRLSGDPLMVRSEHKAGWLDRTTRDRGLNDARRLS